MVVSDDLQSYLDEHISGLDPYLKEVERSTYVNELQPHMVSGIHQGMFLSMLVALKKPKYVLKEKWLLLKKTLKWQKKQEKTLVLLTLEPKLFKLPEMLLFTFHSY